MMQLVIDYIHDTHKSGMVMLATCFLDTLYVSSGCGPVNRHLHIDKQEIEVYSTHRPSMLTLYTTLYNYFAYFPGAKVRVIACGRARNTARLRVIFVRVYA